jgi:hypothetical protein
MNLADRPAREVGDKILLLLLEGGCGTRHYDG